MKDRINMKELNVIEENELYGVIGGCNKEAIVWYKTAINNIKIAEILFNENQTPQCIFSLQQCVETLTKGVLLECGVIKSPRELNHHPEKAFQELYNKKNDTINSKNCNFVLQKIKGNEYNFEKKLPIIAQITNSATTQYSENRLSVSDKEYQNLKYSYVNTALFCLCVLFNSTEAKSRYPEGNIMPSDIFETDNVKKYLPGILNLLKSLIDIITFGLKL